MIPDKTTIKIPALPGAAEARTALTKFVEVLAETNSGLHLARYKLLQK